jgi:hypothetical protein
VPLWINFYVSCQGGLCGDSNGDCQVNISDAVYIINYVFILGSPPPGECCAGGWEGQGGDCCPF